MSQEKLKSESEVTNREGTSEGCDCGPHSCYCRVNKGYEKSTKIMSLTTLIGLINFMPPFDGPISYGPLERLWNFKKQIKEIDPNWL